MLHKQCGERLGLKHFAVRMASPEQSLQLSGYPHGAVTPFAMPAALPVFLSDCIPQLEPRVLYLGGGEPDLKLRLDTQEYVSACMPTVADITCADDGVHEQPDQA